MVCDQLQIQVTEVITLGFSRSTCNLAFVPSEGARSPPLPNYWTNWSVTMHFRQPLLHCWPEQPQLHLETTTSSWEVHIVHAWEGGMRACE